MEAKMNNSPYTDYYDQLITHYDPSHKLVWCYMDPHPRPCFTPGLLRDIRKFQQSVKHHHGMMQSADGVLPIQYLVFASVVPGTFNLGGDLQLFLELINNKDREGLLSYAHHCIEPGYQFSINLDLPLTTISLVQGDALGGGFEAALSSTLLIAERSASMGLPEILFNLFPGMGAYSFLSRRLDHLQTEKLILSGRIYSAAELCEMGVVDILAEDGKGEEAVLTYIKRHSRYHNAHQAVYKVRQRLNQVTYEELADVTRIWVDAALRLGHKDLRIMERLVRAQDKKYHNTPETRTSRRKHVIWDCNVQSARN